MRKLVTLIAVSLVTLAGITAPLYRPHPETSILKKLATIGQPLPSKCVRTAPAAFGPTTAVKSSSDIFLTRTRLPAAFSRAPRRFGPIPGITSSSETSAPFDRRWR